jgi:hypothetical protein
LAALHFTQTNELYQLAAVAFCLLFAWVSFYSFFRSTVGLLAIVHKCAVHNRVCRTASV